MPAHRHREAIAREANEMSQNFLQPQVEEADLQPHMMLKL